MKNQYKITVFTATFNRSSLLKNIYEDLKSQTFKDFEWLIVDDGSTDNTEIEVKKWINDNLLDINYIYKKNGGRHSAINLGCKHANGELFLLLDSDDRILKDSLSIINNIWDRNSHRKNISGILTLCKNADNILIGSRFPNDLYEAHFDEIYYKYHVIGDKFTCFKTEILKQYPFPEEDGIKFIMESIVWHEMSKKYKMICRNEILQIVNYQTNGLSNTEYSYDKINGLAFSYMTLINNKTYSIFKYPRLYVFNYIYLIAYSFLYRLNYYKRLTRISSKVCYIILSPIGYILYKKMYNYLKNKRGNL